MPEGVILLVIDCMERARILCLVGCCGCEVLALTCL